MWPMVILYTRTLEFARVQCRDNNVRGSGLRDQIDEFTGLSSGRPNNSTAVYLKGL